MVRISDSCMEKIDLRDFYGEDDDGGEEEEQKENPFDTFAWE